MSTSTIVNRRILVNITNMEDHDVKTVMEKVSGGIDKIRDVKGVQAEPTPAASSLPLMEQVSLPSGENINKNDYIDKKTVRYFTLLFLNVRNIYKDLNVSSQFNYSLGLDYFSQDQSHYNILVFL